MVCDILYFMNIQLTKKQVVGLYQSLLEVGKLRGVKFAYAVAKNTLILEPEVVAIQKMYNESKGFEEYNKKRIQIAEKYAIKENGKSKKYMKDGVEMYEIGDNVKFTEEIKSLQAEYEPAIKERELQIQEIDKEMEKTITVDLQMIHISDVPNEIESRQMTNIFIIISDKKVVN